MLSPLQNNLVFLRKEKGLTQAEAATALGLTRSTYANYEAGTTEPSLSTLVQISGFYQVTLDEMLSKKLGKVQVSGIDKAAKSSNLVQDKVQDKVQVRGKVSPQNQNFPPGSELGYTHKPSAEPVAPKLITVDSAGQENVLYVPVKARAGYLAGYGDAQYMEKLAAYRLPGYNNGTYRIFEVDGISMFNTLQDRDRCVARWSQVSEIIDDRVYVLVTRNDGLLIKRCINRYQEGKIICKSDNNHSGEYPPIVLDISDILEVWYVVERWTRQLPPPGELYKRITNLEADMLLLKRRLDG